MELDEGSEYYPSLRSQLIGGLQWGVTLFVIVSLLSDSQDLYKLHLYPLFSQWLPHPHNFNLVYIDMFLQYSFELLILALIAGGLWVRYTTGSENEDRLKTNRRKQIVIAAPLTYYIFPYFLYVITGLFPGVIIHGVPGAKEEILKATIMILVYVLVYSAPLYEMIRGNSM